MTDQQTHQPAQIEADPEIPAIHISREFAATPAQVLRAHTDPAIFARWIGPADSATTIDYWDARTGGSWRFEHLGQGFHGCFHEVGDRIVQTFTWEGMPEAVTLELLTVEDLGGGRTLLRATSHSPSFAQRDGMLASGMAGGVNAGYAKLDALLAAGEVSA